jgi:hypothetical protein
MPPRKVPLSRVPHRRAICDPLAELVLQVRAEVAKARTLDRREAAANAAMKQLNRFEKSTRRRLEAARLGEGRARAPNWIISTSPSKYPESLLDVLKTAATAARIEIEQLRRSAVP